MPNSIEDMKQWLHYPQTIEHIKNLQEHLQEVLEKYSTIEDVEPLKEYGKFKENQGKERAIKFVLNSLDDIKQYDEGEK